MTYRELDLEIENIRFGFFDEEIKRKDYFTLNPDGLIPTIRDGEFVFWETLAINLYLAKKHGHALYPDTLEGEALVWQWSFWAVTRV